MPKKTARVLFWRNTLKTIANIHIYNINIMESKIKYINKRDGVEITSDDLALMPIERLEELKAEILYELAELKGNLEETKRLYKEGELVDMRHVSRMKAAKYYRGAFLQRIALEQRKRTQQLKDENRERSKLDTERFERLFMRVSKEVLPEEIYVKILQETRMKAEEVSV